jgi:hypothetical protein
MQRKKERAAASTCGEPCEIDHAVEQISLTNKPEPRPGLVDKWGHPHSEAIFRNWSPAAIRALGIRRIKAKGGARR